MSPVNRTELPTVGDTEGEQVSERLSVVLKSHRLLSEIRDGTDTPGALSSALGVARSTVYNWSKDLEEEGLLRRRNGTLSLTTSGRYHLEMHREVLASSSVAGRACEVLASIPDRHLPPWQFLGDLTVNRDTGNVAKHRETYARIIGDVSRLRVVMPRLFTPTLEQSVEEVRDGEIEATYVFSRQVLEQVTDQYREFSERLVEDDDKSLHVFEYQPSFIVGVFEGSDDLIALSGFNDAGYPTGFLCARSDRLVQWGHDVVDEYLAGDDVQEVRDIDGLPDHP